MEALKVIELIPYSDFKEKIQLTKEYERKAKIEIIDNKYVYVERIEEECDHLVCTAKSDI